MASIAITTPGSIWDEASKSEVVELAQQFESAWKLSRSGSPPDPIDFLDPQAPSPTALLLALLRVDLAHRLRSGEGTRVESYRDRHDGIRGDALVALVYEDYCLREEAGETPEVGDYLNRFPEIADRLREVLEIHELVAEPGSTAPDFETHSTLFPEVGQTIAGFHLVEELGRGSFARVFLANERQLGDRPVALKVSKTGSREPQTLARLQHTHIVPIHSYRVDAVTGLHLLCMPYFGRVTLARILADASLGNSRRGLDLIAALDRIGSTEPESSVRSTARSRLASLSYPRSIAWWGARMAEGLQHAHDRGVLHRDVKPSNVLIASDGMPMLLDFNLARESDFQTASATRLGGTLAYMAPEHLDALGERHDRAIDHRADIYSLGMVLLEALGVKPTTGPSEATTLVDSLTWLIENRRREAPRLVESPLEIPLALEVVVRRCLAPDPDERYSSAAELAADLQAVADDAPLAFSAEPWRPRVRRWLQNHGRKLALAAPLILAISTLALLQYRSRADQIHQVNAARDLVRDGVQSTERGEFRSASVQFVRALNLIRDRGDLLDFQAELFGRIEAAETAQRTRDQADAFFVAAEPLRLAFLGFVGDRFEASRKLVEALQPFDVGGDGNWIDRPSLRDLDPGRKKRLLREVDDLLFFSVLAQALETRDPASASQNALDYCDKALRFTDRAASWKVLQNWWANPARNRPNLPVDPRSETSAASCFRWYLLGKLALTSDASMAWLERATRLEPDNYWHQYALAYERNRQGRPDLAISSANAAVALRPVSAWAWKIRARISWNLGRWAPALEDLDQALTVATTTHEKLHVRLDRGRFRHLLGDFEGANHDDYFVKVIAPEGSPLARDAGRNLAKLDADRGFDSQALLLYKELLASDPQDFLSRHGRVRLQLRRGQPDLANADLTCLIASGPAIERASYHAERAVVGLVTNRPIEAVADALAAFRLEPTAQNARLIDRARLASHLDLERWPEDPSEFDLWPDQGPALVADLQSAATRLESRIQDPGGSGWNARLARAVIFSALGQNREALAEADRLVAFDSRSLRVLKCRALIRERAGKLEEAWQDVANGLRIAPEDTDLVEIRGRIRFRQGDLERALIDLKGISPTRAELLEAVGRPEEAAEVWSKLVERTPLDVRSWLGLAQARLTLRDWDSALIALEAAAGAVDDRSPCLGQIAWSYARCLPARPTRWPRLIDLGRRMVRRGIR